MFTSAWKFSSNHMGSELLNWLTNISIHHMQTPALFLKASYIFVVIDDCVHESVTLEESFLLALVLFYILG